jgi:hypothetical protein
MKTDDFHIAEIPQDTISGKLQIRENRAPQLLIPTAVPNIDLEKAREVIETAEQRKQEITTRQRRTVITPRMEQVKKPSIEIDTLMAKYSDMGCVPVADFPVTTTLTMLEQYYQPMTQPLPLSSGITETGGLAVPADSVSAVPETITAQTPEIFSGFRGDIREETYPSIVTVLLLVSLIFFTWIKFHFGKSLSQSFRAFFNYYQARKSLEERKEADKQATFYSSVLFFFNTGIFFSLLFSFFDLDQFRDSYILTVTLFSVATFLLYYVKAGIWKFFGSVFMLQGITKEYIYNVSLYNRNVGLFIFPLIGATPFVSCKLTFLTVYGVIFIFCAAYLLRTFRIFQIIRTQNVSPFYFILYLCTLEFLPLLLFAKTCKLVIMNVSI